MAGPPGPAVAPLDGLVVGNAAAGEFEAGQGLDVAREAAGLRLAGHCRLAAGENSPQRLRSSSPAARSERRQPSPLASWLTEVRPAELQVPSMSSLGGPSAAARRDAPRGARGAGRQAWSGPGKALCRTDARDRPPVPPGQSLRALPWFLAWPQAPAFASAHLASTPLCVRVDKRPLEPAPRGRSSRPALQCRPAGDRRTIAEAIVLPVPGGRRVGSARGQRPVEIGVEVVGILDADEIRQQGRTGHGVPAPRSRRGARSGSRRRRARSRASTARPRPPRPPPRTRRRRPDRQHRAEAALHLRAASAWPGCPAGRDTAPHAPRDATRNRGRGRRAAGHLGGDAHVQGAQAAQQQVGFERPEGSRPGPSGCAGSGSRTRPAPPRRARPRSRRNGR